jgi:hypothetical protein
VQVGKLQFGYEQSPLEQRAYSLQQLFERASVPNDLVRIIETERTRCGSKQHRLSGQNETAPGRYAVTGGEQVRRNSGAVLPARSSGV